MQTVEPRKFEVLRARGFILNNQYFFFPSNISVGHVKETSHGDVSFTQPKHMLLKTVIQLDHE